MNKIAKFIVEKRALFFVLFAALIIYAIIGIPKVGIEYSITSYLPKDTDTAKSSRNNGRRVRDLRGDEDNDKQHNLRARRKSV